MPAQPHPSDCVYAVLGSHIVCVEVATGQERWRSKVPSGSTTIASLIIRDDLAIVGCSGRLHCFDARSGALLWTNELKGLGYGSVFMGSSADAQAAAAERATSDAAIPMPD